METHPKEKSEQELCQIRIMFPVSSDEDAIACKKKIKEALSDKPDAQMQFTIMPVPSNTPLSMR